MEEERIEPAEYEIAFERLWHHAQHQPYAVKTTEAPHYRRFVLQHGGDPLAGPRRRGKAGLGIRDWGLGLSGSRQTHPSQPPAPKPQSPIPFPSPRLHRAPLGVGDGKGVMFVGHSGEIYPAGFLPLCCGRFPANSVVEVYQSHPTFLMLRDPDRFGGRCGICEFRHICGGSRARAYAVTGDPLAAEPDCIYEPAGYRR